jgi:propanol-preferring alcohol dehydrogenase
MNIVTKTSIYPLRQANEALADLRAGRFEGAAVLVPSPLTSTRTTIQEGLRHDAHREP